jgi:YidC/Oxa1 family membrane protein insertase
MGILNLLNTADVAIGLFGQTYDVYLNFIGKIIRFLITGVGTVGVGIILFSLVLKLIVMPFDVYQRIAMRKQNRLMKENQARMEKLQKQYGNDKEKYNQKLMEMYKENGINMFSSCLPMILSMVIFFVAIGAFNAYSQYSNIENYNTMVNAYNAKMETYCADLTAENLQINGNVITVKDADASKYIYYTITLAEDEKVGETKEEQIAYVTAAAHSAKEYKIDVVKAYANEEIKTFIDKAVADAVAEQKVKAENAQEGEEIPAELTAEQKSEVARNAIKNYFTKQAQNSVLETYESEVINHTKFLWIKNIWATDASYKHPILNYTDFKAEISREKFEVAGEEIGLAEVTNFTDAYKEETYNLVTGGLGAHKTEANGWYILILLSIGTILLQQWVSNRAQKEQQQFSTVDGQGASQQKTMMIVMTGMFAVFSFMYSSAFSIYMITSNIFSLISMLVINKLVDTVENKKDAQREQEKYNQRFPGRTQKTNNADNKNEKADKKNDKK